MHLIAKIKRIWDFFETEQGKLLLLISASLVSLAIILTIATPYFFTSQYLKKELSAEFAEVTGHKLTIAGDVKAELLPWPTLTVYKAALYSSNAPKKTPPVMMADSMKIELNPVALLMGIIRAEHMIINKASFALNVNEEGRPEWALKGQQENFIPPNEKFSYMGAFLDVFKLLPYNSMPEMVTLKNVVIDYSNASTKRMVHVHKLNTTFELNKSNSQMQVRGSGVINNNASDWSFTASNVRSFYTLERSHINGSFTNNSYSVFLNGFLEQGIYRGDLNLSINSIASLWPDAMKHVPLSYINSPLEFSIRDRNIQCERYRCFINRGNFTLDRIGGIIDGEISYQHEVPLFKLNIESKKANLNQFLRTRKSKKPKANKALRPWQLSLTKEAISSTESVIPTLPPVEIDVQLKAKKLFVNQYRFDDATFDIRLNERLLDISIKEADAFEGKMNAHFTLDTSITSPQWILDIDLDKVDIAIIIKKLTNKHFVSGNAAIKANLITTGSSPSELAENLSGNGKFEVKNGHVASADFGDMFRNIADAFSPIRRQVQSNLFQSLYGSFNVQNGIITNDDLTFIASLLQFQGKGKVVLPEYNANYTLIPQRVIKLGGLAGINNKINYPILISGKLDAVDMQADTQHPIDNDPRISKGKAKAKAKRKQQSKF
jgi:AsmA protein